MCETEGTDPGANVTGWVQVKSRRTDGRPETPADRRFFDLRAAGYDGLIDERGFAVTGRNGDPVAGHPEDRGGR